MTAQPKLLRFLLRWLIFLALLAAILYFGEVSHSRWVSRKAGATFEAVGARIGSDIAPTKRDETPRQTQQPIK